MLSIHADRSTIAVLDPGDFDTPSTKQAAGLLADWAGRGSVLLVLAEEQARVALSFRNLPRVSVLPATGVGVADLVGASRVLVTEEALSALTARARGERAADDAAARGGRRLMHPSQVIIRPVVSEKSYVLAAADKYTFRVHPDAHKTQIRQAIETLFDVKVLEVRTASVRSKPKRRGLTAGRTRAWKKAIVQVRPGDEIPIFQGLQGLEG